MNEAVAPGGKLRFRVHDDALGDGSSWTVTTSSKTGDVVVSHREGAKWLHATFHESGEWHYAVTASALEMVPDTSKYFGVAQRSAALAPGWVRAMVITVAHSELRSDYKESKASKSVVAVPIDPSADATEVWVLLAERDAARIRVDNVFRVGLMARGDGGQVVVLASPATLTQPVHEGLASAIAEAKVGLRTLGWDGSTLLRIVINGLNDAGFMQQFEIAIDSENKGPETTPVHG